MMLLGFCADLERQQIVEKVGVGNLLFRCLLQARGLSSFSI
jgi:hypothetical protein